MNAQQILSTIILVLSSQQQCNARSLLRRQDNDTESSNTNIDRELHGTSSRDTNRIIGGNEAVEDRHAYAVSLYDNIGHFCGGSLIAKDVVLTAAHCKGGEYFAVAGRHNIEDE